MVCSSTGAYTLRGCTAIQCTRPADTSGYAINAEILDVPRFGITVLCAAGYAGSAAEATLCETGGPYSLSGCTACTGANDFSDDPGQAPCKQCPAGSFGVDAAGDRSQPHTACDNDTCQHPTGLPVNAEIDAAACPEGGAMDALCALRCVAGYVVR